MTDDTYAVFASPHHGEWTDIGGGVEVRVHGDEAGLIHIRRSPDDIETIDLMFGPPPWDWTTVADGVEVQLPLDAPAGTIYVRANP